MNKDFIPYALPSYTDKEKQNVLDVLQSLWWSRGKMTDKFEEQFKNLTNSPFALGLNSCTAGLHTALSCFGVGSGDEVITTTITFCSTANIISHAGAKPVFCDIDEDTGLIDTNSIEKLITEKTKAIIPVDYAGAVADIDTIKDVISWRNIKIIEDAAHSVFSTYKGKPVGNLSDATAFSFYATKNLATGEGGMLTTNNEEMYNKAKSFSLHGLSKNAHERYTKKGSHAYDVLCAGYKYNITDIASALGVAQLDRKDEMQNRRKVIKDIYDEKFKNKKYFSLLKIPSYCESDYHLYIIKLNLETLKIDRDEFINHLSENKIGTSVHFRPVHTMSLYRNLLGKVSLPHAENYYKSIISLPLYPSLKDEEADYVCTTVLRIAEMYAK